MRIRLFGTRWVAVQVVLIIVVQPVFLPVSEAQVTADQATRLQWTSDSAEQLYTATVRPEPAVIPIGAMHRWTLELHTADGEPVYPAQISIGGGMQNHGHGLPTQPRAVAYGGDGVYLIDGVRFTMEGKWRLSFVIASDYGFDRVDFDILVE